MSTRGKTDTTGRARQQRPERVATNANDSPKAGTTPKEAAKDTTAPKWRGPRESSRSATTYTTPLEREAVHRLAEVIHGERQEFATIVTPQGKIIKTFTGTAGKATEANPEVKLPVRLLGGNLTIHNHPTNEFLGVTSYNHSFSTTDVQVAMTRGMDSHHVVTDLPNGGYMIYSMRPPAGHSWTADSWKAIQETVHKADLREMVNRTPYYKEKDTPMSRSEGHNHAIWSEVARKYPKEMTYTWEYVPPSGGTPTASRGGPAGAIRRLISRG